MPLVGGAAKVGDDGAGLFQALGPHMGISPHEIQLHRPPPPGRDLIARPTEAVLHPAGGSAPHFDHTLLNRPGEGKGEAMGREVDGLVVASDIVGNLGKS
jgi:hypothetical protein